MSDSFLLNLLPPAWRQDSLARGIANALGRPLDVSRRYAETLYRYVDPEGAPEDALDWLMYVVALPINRGLSARRKRNLIHTAWQTWSSKGSKGSIEAWVRAVVGVTAEVRNLADSAFIAGLSLAGDVCGPGELANKWELAIPDGSIDPTELRRLLEPVVPSQTSYRIVDLHGSVLDDFPA